MLNKQKDWFVNSSAWFNWSRVLQRRGGTFEKGIEVSVSPINRDWEALKEVRIRVHSTSETNDRFHHHFPDSIGEDLLANVGKEITHTILNGELLREIDWPKFKLLDKEYLGGGGLPFILICRNPKRYPELRQYWKELLLVDSEAGHRARTIKKLHDFITNKQKVKPKANPFGVTTIQVNSNNLGIPRGSYNAQSLNIPGANYVLEGHIIKELDFTTTDGGRLYLMRQAAAGHIIQVRMEVTNGVPHNVEISNYQLGR